MGDKSTKMFLLLDDNTIISARCPNFKSPKIFKGKKVLAAATYLADFDLLRMIFGEKSPRRRILEIKIPLFPGSKKKLEMKLHKRYNTPKR